MSTEEVVRAPGESASQASPRHGPGAAPSPPPAAAARRAVEAAVRKLQEAKAAAERAAREAEIAPALDRDAEGAVPAARGAAARTAAAEDAPPPKKRRWRNLPADTEKRYDSVATHQVGTEFVEDYLAAYREIHEKGGIVTSAGDIRKLDAVVRTGRSPTSLHYVGRAIDFALPGACNDDKDRFIVVRDGANEKGNPYWRVYCVVAAGSPGSSVQTLAAHMWGKDSIERTESVISITDIMAKHGWVRIAARDEWETDYRAYEWWHFQNEKGLVEGTTTLGDELRMMEPYSKPGFLEGHAVAPYLGRVWGVDWF